MTRPTGFAIVCFQSVETGHIPVYYVHGNGPLKPATLTNDASRASRLTHDHAADIARLGVKVWVDGPIYLPSTSVRILDA